MFAAFLTTVFYSISAVAGSRSSRALGGVRANFWRLIVATLFLAAYANTLGGGMRGHATGVFLLSGLVGIGFGDIGLFEAYPRLGPRLTILIVQCLSAPFGALIEWLWLGTMMTGPQLLCGAVILAGVALALSDVPDQHVNARGFAVGIAFAVAGALGNAMGAVLSRKAFAIASLAGESVDGITAAYQRVFGGLAVVGIMYVLVRLHRSFILQSADAQERTRPGSLRQAWPWVVLNGLAGLTLGVSCYQWALKTQPTGVVLPIVAITPIVTVPFTRYLDGEKPTWRSLSGGFIAVVAAFGLAGGFAWLRNFVHPG
jgi:drug/metabolite transporter (DMT)-like permease